MSHALRLLALFAFLFISAFFLIGSAPPVEGDRPGFLTGTLRSAVGAPLAPARVLVLVEDRGGATVAATRDLDASGHYALRLPPPGDHRVRAFAELDRSGRPAVVELAPVGGAALSAGDAVVKDFRLDVRF
jgi:hypothetical protein